jgi:hypothetical protein
MKITIKLPQREKGKFKVQSRGFIEGRAYRTGAGAIERILELTLRTELKEKTAIVIKEYIDSHFVNINETLASTNSEYLLYATTCFLENFISPYSFDKAEKRWLAWSAKGGAEL